MIVQVVLKLLIRHLVTILERPIVLGVLLYSIVREVDKLVIRVVGID